MYGILGNRWPLDGSDIDCRRLPIFLIALGSPVIVSLQRELQMKTFHGTFEELQARVTATGRKGLWSDITKGKQF
jgi:hypothetical protein